jgi:hypothetical protein
MAVKAHYGRYYQASLILYGLNPNRGVSVFYIIIGDQYIPITTYPTTTPVDPDLKKPYAESFIFGLETGLGKNFALKVNGIFKEMKNYIGQIDLNRTSEWYDPVEINNPITNSTMTVFSLKPGAPATQPYYTHPSEAERKYKALEIFFERRLANNFQFFLSYVLSKTEGTVPLSVWGYGGNRTYGTWNDPNFLINKSGVSDLDRTHQIKFSGVYYLPLDFVIGLNYVGQSGYPYARTFNYSVRQGTLTLNGEELGSNRLPFQHLVDLRIEKNLNFGNFRSRVFMEVYNLLNSNADISRGTLYGSPTFLKATAILPPRILKLGVGFEF